MFLRRLITGIWVRLKIYVSDSKYEKALVTDITLRVLEAFEAEGIQPPAILHRNADEGRITQKSAALMASR